MPTWTSKNRHISNRHDTTNLNPLMMHFLFHILCIEKTWFKTFVYSLQSSILPPKTVECFMKNLAPHFILPVLSFLSRLIKCHHNLSQSTNQERILPSLEIRQWQQGATDCGCSLPDLRLLGKTIRKRMPKLVGCREKRRETRWIFLRLKIIGAKAEGSPPKFHVENLMEKKHRDLSMFKTWATNWMQGWHFGHVALGNSDGFCRLRTMLIPQDHPDCFAWPPWWFRKVSDFGGLILVWDEELNSGNSGFVQLCYVLLSASQLAQFFENAPV